MPRTSLLSVAPLTSKLCLHGWSYCKHNPAFCFYITFYIYVICVLYNFLLRYLTPLAINNMLITFLFIWHTCMLAICKSYIKTYCFLSELSNHSFNQVVHFGRVKKLKHQHFYHNIFHLPDLCPLNSPIHLSVCSLLRSSLQLTFLSIFIISKFSTSVFVQDVYIHLYKLWSWEFSINRCAAPANYKITHLPTISS